MHREGTSEGKHQEATFGMHYRLKPFSTFAPALAGLLLITAGLAVAGPSAHAQSPTMRVEPASQTVDVGGGNFTVNIRIDNVTNLGAYDIELTFNPSVLRFVAVEDSGFLGSTGRQLRCPSPFLDSLNKPGDTLRFGCATQASTPPQPDGSTLPGPSGSGVLASVTFAPRAAGNSLLTPGSESGWAPPFVPGDEIIPVVMRGAQVTVVGEGPAATPRPDEPTPLPVRDETPVANLTPTPDTSWMFTPEPGQTPMTRPMPGRQMTSPSADGVTAAYIDPSGSSAANRGSPRAGTGPEQNTSRWPTLTGLTLMVGGIILLSFAAYTRKGRGHGNR
jgi:hypothetical protein